MAKLTSAKVQELYTAINGLNGYVRQATVNGRDMDVQQPYVFSTETTLAILANRKALRKIIEADDETRNDLIKQLSGGGDKVEPGSAQMAQFMSAYQLIMATEHDVDLKTITIADLNPGPVNPILVETLDRLEPIIK
jgi:hypothetical protein